MSKGKHHASGVNYAMSSVWKYALKRKNPITKESEGVCNKCGQVIKLSGRSTTGLRNHLKQKHGIDVDLVTEEKDETVEVVKKPKTMLDYLEHKNLKEIVADLATDGITIRVITRNKYIRDSIQRDGFKLPANESDVMRLIHEDYEDKKNKMASEIQKKIQKGGKFSMTIDEYTTVRGRRYFGVNIHDSDEKKTFKTVRDHLSTFGINMEQDLVGSTQDGAAVNKKFMGMLDIIGQFCLNHGIHLAVCDVLYKKVNTSEKLTIDIGCDDEKDDDEFDDGCDLETAREEISDEINYYTVLKAARDVIKYIKNSTVRNQIFQSKVNAQFGHDVELHLDVKHR
ncbi:unnamed protein product [Didymodactylos carnosus]|uniref:BED-type domain-containing protein n=1 Tax=Didymodactylos carnosus TaxID=1234261 RepID=A0A8S2DRQ0_9BILA|nr:unnamed protein product [Didymodactylos carnosus]CAF3755733.1 unnamed protein product [Didymodactylos carnosus]